jgi:hypothetical protein
MATRKKKHSILWKKSYLWVTLTVFLLSLSGHWFFGWQAYVQEQEEHKAPILASEYSEQMLRDTLENWQSEFLQLIWQIAGLAYLLYVGSPTSKEGDERREAKLDYLIEKLEPQKHAELLKKWEEQYPKS